LPFFEDFLDDLDDDTWKPVSEITGGTGAAEGLLDKVGLFDKDGLELGCLDNVGFEETLGAPDVDGAALAKA